MVRRFLKAYGELVFVFGLGLLAQIELWLDQEWAADRYELAPVALAMTAILLLRIRAPLPTLLLELAALQLASSLNTVPNNDPMGVILPVAVALYSTGAHTRGRVFAVGSPVVLAAIVAAMVQDESSLNVSGFLFFAFFIGGPFVGGAVMRIRREREQLLVRQRDEGARAAVADERTRIARELHDVVAHAISVIVLQARGARHSLAVDPEDSRHAIDAIERTASQALGEMRRLLAILRADDVAAALAPQASLTQLDVLADEVRAAGLPVEIAIAGAPASSRPASTPPPTGSCRKR